MSMLMVRKPQEMTNLMNKNSDKLLPGFIRHSQSFSIAELLKRLLQPYQCGTHSFFSRSRLWSQASAEPHRVCTDYMDDMDYPGMSVGFPSSQSWYGAGSHDDDTSSVGTPTASSQKALSWQQDTKVIDLLLANLQPTDAAGNAVDSDIHKHSAEV